MSDPLIGIAGFFVALFLVAFGAPLAIAVGVVGALGFLVVNGWSSTAFIFGSTLFNSVASYNLSVVPLFLMMGIFAARTGLSSSLFAAVNAFVGHFRGGLAIASIGACAGFGAICGSSLATTATMTRVAFPEMRKRGYDDSLAAGAIAAGGTLGVLIPPSIILVIYALLTESSIGKLFLAAILPGLLGTFLYALGVVVQTRINPELATSAPKLGWGARGRALIEVWPVVALFGLVMGGIYFGFFSPTEAAAVGAAGAILVAILRRTLSRDVFSKSVRETVELTGMLFMVLVGATVFNAFIETTQLPNYMIAAIEGMGLAPLGVLVIIIMFYLVLGCLMDGMSMILLTVPIVFPVVTALGYDPIWFGILVVTVTEISLITPPIGMNLFVIKGVVGDDLATGSILRGVVPFILADIVRVVLLVAFPAIALWLPTTA